MFKNFPAENAGYINLSDFIQTMDICFTVYTLLQKNRPTWKVKTYEEKLQHAAANIKKCHEWNTPQKIQGPLPSVKFPLGNQI